MLKLTLTTLAAVFVVLAVWGQRDTAQNSANPDCGAACAQPVDDAPPQSERSGALIVPIEYAPTPSPDVLRPAPGKPPKP
ncbi:hypothetical protein LZA78_13710 [Sinirhodobacter sp. WL0062]|uniref:Uncharacterized protein n=1 Tax=Rhodobacter flavimaris TaxID=2907145 RepID=A0ABS8Z198_9RHOB|nr:hypothetical protein [Sinirhodobacter sp. WL0062]MCE5974539.1 hypothetical protein [Sinirhodobacter sp. WL0062]